MGNKEHLHGPVHYAAGHYRRRRWSRGEEDVAGVPDPDGGAEEKRGAGDGELGRERGGSSAAGEDLGLLLEDLLLGDLGARKEPPLLFVVVAVSMAVGGMGGAHWDLREEEVAAGLASAGGATAVGEIRGRGWLGDREDHQIAGTRSLATDPKYFTISYSSYFIF